jgi:hypothetical protein
VAFIEFFPLGEKHVLDLKTSTSLEVQLWQEFVMLRHSTTTKRIAAPKSIAPWIDQAKTYFLDAWNSDWRSAGLLYYYSFLNLAKAYLVAKRTFTYKFLDSTSVYHGLSADLQSPTSLSDYTIKVYPQVVGNRHNVFSNFYHTVTKSEWPFSEEISLQLSDVAGYYPEISAELSRLFGISKGIIPVQSLLRLSGNDVWFEMIVPKAGVGQIKQAVAPWKLEELEMSKWSESDKNDWLIAFHRTPQSLTNHLCLRSDKITSKRQIPSSLYKQVAVEAIQKLEEFAIPQVSESARAPHWLFVPKIKIKGAEILWHPLLSDYLIAFMLSTVLRYQPQLLAKTSQNSFIAEA